MTTTATQTDMMLDLRFFLSTGATVTVKFKKKDGTIRTAAITTNQTRMPDSKLPKYKRGSNPRIINAFDVDKGDWISFHEDQLISIMER